MVKRVSRLKKVEIVKPNNQWPELFQAEAAKIKEALSPIFIDIHHIGSTAIPGLPAKPIIDIVPVVTNITKLKDCQKALENIGYDVHGEFGMPCRCFCTKGEPRTFQLHIFEEGSAEIDRHLHFVNFLKSHPEKIKAYGDLKQQLAKEYPDDIQRYCEGKSEFVLDIDSQSGYEGYRIVRVITDEELNAYNAIIEKSRFSLPFMDALNLPEISDEQFICFVCYKGSKIIGAAYITSINQATQVQFLEVFPEYQAHDKQEFNQLVQNWLRKKVKYH